MDGLTRDEVHVGGEDSREVELVREYNSLKQSERDIKGRMKEIKGELEGILNERDKDKMTFYIDETKTTISRVTTTSEFVSFKQLPDSAKQQLREAGYVSERNNNYIRITMREEE